MSFSTSQNNSDLKGMAKMIALARCLPKAPFHNSGFLRAGPVQKRSSSQVCFSTASSELQQPMGGGSLKIVGISGSLRAGSFNSGLIRTASEIVKEHVQDAQFEQLQISELPMLNTDLEQDGHFPDVVEVFRAKVLEADAILFASPEYNYSIAAPLKNAIDWASRPPNVWADKPAAIMSAGGGFGGGRSQYHLRQVGVYIDLHFINKPELFVAAFQPPQKFDAQGNLVDSVTRDRVKDLVLALRKWTLRLKSQV